MEYENTEICGSCDGSGEWIYDGSICPVCEGKGIVYVDDSESLTPEEEAAYNYHPDENY